MLMWMKTSEFGCASAYGVKLGGVELVAGYTSECPDSDIVFRLFCLFRLLRLR
jgi:hypothetical protein